MCHDYSANPGIGSTFDEIAAQFGIELKGAPLRRELRRQKEFTVILRQSASRRGQDQIHQQLWIDRQGKAGLILIYKTPLHPEIRSAEPCNESAVGRQSGSPIH